MRKTLLSTRIKKRLKRCLQCHGKGHYKHKKYNIEVACNDCWDWLVVLRGVKELEEQIKEKDNVIRSKITIS